MLPYSVYLHIPFCKHRCGYCDFNTYANIEHLIHPYTEALINELAYSAASTGARLPVHTLFFGGGTPSILPLQCLASIMSAVQCSFDLLPGPEVTLEANPGTLDLPYLDALLSLGINRLSLGMQSADPDELRLLERAHGFLQVIQAVNLARKAGFVNLNLDLIYGLPGQSLETWRKSLNSALDLHPDHLSLYALTIEHGTPLADRLNRGLIAEPDPDLAAEMYEDAMEMLERAGFVHYEISNWARESRGELLSCRHNLQYWRNQPYLGFGAGAHGYASGVRTVNTLSPTAYIQRCLSPITQSPEFPRTQATQSSTPVDRTDQMGEMMMMGLRLTQEGMADQTFRDCFGVGLRDVFRSQIERLVNLELLEWAGNGGQILRLTRRGYLLGNQVFMEFLE